MGVKQAWVLQERGNGIWFDVFFEATFRIRYGNGRETSVGVSGMR